MDKFQTKTHSTQDSQNYQLKMEFQRYERAQQKHRESASAHQKNVLHLFPLANERRDLSCPQLSISQDHSTWDALNKKSESH